ncbi:MAG TPA: VWA domain-containing protein [Chloroflexota bacterium]
MVGPSGGTGTGTVQGGGLMVHMQLQARPERQLIRPQRSLRHIDFVVRVEEAPQTGDRRQPLTVALVLDRSGSMQGDKLTMARRAALAALDRLDERDQVAVVVFDDRIDVLQRAAPVTAAVKEQVRAALTGLAARGSTALHEGWATGCRAIVGDTLPATERGLAHLMLLTDGIANVGLTDPEAIASEAAGVREQAGISTSTFGIGADYNESLLAPMATAGGGQFHHLRTTADIANAFLGELGLLFGVAAGGVALELAVDPGVSAELISEYWLTTSESTHYRVAVGDLLSGEERHVVVRFGFPAWGQLPNIGIRARLCWTAGGEARSSAWQEVRFSYAGDAICDAEPRDATVMHWVGLHHAYRAQHRAAEQSRDGNLAGAGRTLADVAERIQSYADSDSELQEAVSELTAFRHEALQSPLAPMVAKDRIYSSQRLSKSQRDLRSQPPDPQR